MISKIVTSSTVMESKHESRCYLCKLETLMTKHHIIPKRYNSTINATIEICKNCHELLNNLEREDSKKILELEQEVKKLNESLRIRSQEVNNFRSICVKINNMTQGIL